jgi:hypothetical protein
LLVYLPHLDYDQQRFGPESPDGEPRGCYLEAEWRRENPLHKAIWPHRNQKFRRNDVTLPFTA